MSLLNMKRGESILLALVITSLLFAFCNLVLDIRAVSSLAICALSLFVLLIAFYSPHRITTEEADMNLGVYLVLLFASLVFIALYTLGMAISDTKSATQDNTQEIIDLYVM